MLICYDVEFPEAVRRLALAGAGLVVVPTANMEGFEAVPRLLVPARAYENGLVVAYANCCGVRPASSTVASVRWPGPTAACWREPERLRPCSLPSSSWR